ncbi:hypothetical protein EMIHUDRAFT_469859 [Emiliania huxleyi CCMP1516]|uniref:Uncharacterized protein n=2 Tax=Emiliania huxleyi TaxID=2903 RepID=A0A0D3JCG3_EMIH1|nr:hypothetical protein EMIHUDRAFT_469859 [Emiliania huxleyi CCMP1516]EOD21198.1 hypothetical protein EMIHUDRAFT_469859 [Emiliania huxleyi CCMP1516]|eukprot:XP_005773627.1 hypothetical protein EMIHUDRAFT_469859 [Emiliania huxleyi CCMP1516]
MEEEGAVGESEEEEEGAVVDVGVSDSEEELEVLQQPNLIQKLADVVSTITVAVLVQNVGTMGLYLRQRKQRGEPFLQTAVDMPVLCSKIAEGKAAELEGFQMMINCYAGID